MKLLALIALVALDAGMPDAGVRTPPPGPHAPAKSSEDQEIIDNLELLQHLDESSDLELMQELSVER